MKKRSGSRRSQDAMRSSESPYDAAVSMWLTPCSSSRSSVRSASAGEKCLTCIEQLLYGPDRTIANPHSRRSRSVSEITPSVDRLSGRAWAALLVLCGALFLDALDVSMIGVALPSIRSDLHLSTSSLQWVVSAYVLGYGGFLLLGGRAADLLGRRRVFLVSLGVFVVASAR